MSADSLDRLEALGSGSSGLKDMVFGALGRSFCSIGCVRSHDRCGRLC